APRPPARIRAAHQAAGAPDGPSDEGVGHSEGALPPLSKPPPRTQCEPQDVAGLGPRRPRRALRRIGPQDVAGLGPRRPRRALRRIEAQDVAGLGSRRPRRALRRIEPPDGRGPGPARPGRASRTLRPGKPTL